MSTILKKINQMGITKKIAAVYSLVFALIVCLASYVFISVSEERAIKQLINTSKYELSVEVESIERNAVVIERAAQLVVGNNKLRDYLNRIGDVSVLDMMDFKFSTASDIQHIAYNNPEIKDIVVYYENAKGTNLYPILQHKSDLNPRIYDQVVALKNFRFYDLQKDVALYRTMMGYGNDPLGVVSVTMSKENFFKNVYEQMDKKQQIVFTEKEVVTDYESAFEEKYGVLTPKIIQAVKEKVQSGENIFYLEENNEKFLGIYQPSTYLDWEVVNILSLSDIFIQFSSVRFLFIILGLLVIVTVYVFTSYSTRRMLKDLYTITDSMKAVQDGTLPVKINIQSNNELGELAQGYQKLIQKIETLIEDVTKKRLVANEAQLKALQNQIDAHFLFNVLENIKMQAEVEGQFDISDSITSLGQMMRYNINWRGEFVSLKEELTQVQHYVYLMNMRHEGKIVFHVNVDKNVEHMKLLKMSLQPLVENSIQHGGKGILQERSLRITLSIYEQEKNVYIDIQDDGVGIPVERLRFLQQHITQFDGEQKRHIGLKNVNERIKMYYGNSYGMTIQSVEGTYTRCRLIVPKQMQGD